MPDNVERCCALKAPLPPPMRVQHSFPQIVHCVGIPKSCKRVPQCGLSPSPECKADLNWKGSMHGLSTTVVRRKPFQFGCTTISIFTAARIELLVCFV